MGKRKDMAFKNGTTNPYVGGEFLSPQEVADLLKLSVRTLEKWRNKKTGPDWYEFGYNSVRYFDRDLYAWISSKKVIPERGVD